MQVSKELLQTICKSKLIDRSLISKYIPETANKRPSRALDVLLLIYCYPNKTMFYIKSLTRNHSDTISDHINSLIGLGYISKTNRQRFIPQLNCWKGEFVYKVTNSGEIVLKKVFSVII